MRRRLSAYQQFWAGLAAVGFLLLALQKRLSPDMAEWATPVGFVAILVAGLLSVASARAEQDTKHEYRIQPLAILFGSVALLVVMTTGIMAIAVVYFWRAEHAIPQALLKRTILGVLASGVLMVLTRIVAIKEPERTIFRDSHGDHK